jgi:hypothetical protein
MSSADLRRAVYPGSFNPPTTAHLAIAAAVVEQRQIDVVVFSISRRALGKEEVAHPRLHHRLSVLADVVDDIDWLQMQETEDQLLVDIASGFDVLIMGADKWHQINDPIWYDGDPGQRDQALDALPELAIAPRPPLAVPARHRLDIDPRHAETSSTRARAGARNLMATEAQLFALETGAWIDESRYEWWLAAGRPDPGP